MEVGRPALVLEVRDIEDRLHAYSGELNLAWEGVRGLQMACMDAWRKVSEEGFVEMGPGGGTGRGS